MTLMQGYSGDDITNICRDAAMNGMRRKIEGKTAAEIRQLAAEEMAEPVRMEDFRQALSKIKPTVSAADVKRHESWLSDFGSV